MENKDRVKRELEIDKEEGTFVSVLKKTYDYTDKGYFTTTEQRQKIYSKEWCENNLTSLKSERDKQSSDIEKNDAYLKKIYDDNKEHWESKEFNSFMKNYDNKYSKLIKWKKKHDEYMVKNVENEHFKLNLDIVKDFIEHYEEMLQRWEKE